MLGLCCVEDVFGVCGLTHPYSVQSSWRSVIRRRLRSSTGESQKKQLGSQIKMAELPCAGIIDTIARFYAERLTIFVGREDSRELVAGTRHYDRAGFAKKQSPPLNKGKRCQVTPVSLSFCDNTWIRRSSAKNGRVRLLPAGDQSPLLSLPFSMPVHQTHARSLW